MLPFPPAAAPPEAAESITETPQYQAFRRFAQLTALKKRLNEKLREVEPQLRALAPTLLSYFSETGLGKIQVEGFTMSPRRVPWVYPRHGLGRESVCAALKLSGLGRLVREVYNTRSLTAYVRELEEHHQLLRQDAPEALAELLPEELAKVVEVRPSFELQVRDERKGERHADLPEEFKEAFDFEEGESDDQQ